MIERRKYAITTREMIIKTGRKKREIEARITRYKINIDDISAGSGKGLVIG